MAWSLGVVISMRMRLDKQKEIKLRVRPELFARGDA
jgi:hypothetical protein